MRGLVKLDLVGSTVCSFGEVVRNPLDQMWPGDWFGLRSAVTSELCPDADAWLKKQVVALRDGEFHFLEIAV
jgi:hypothetical protein